MKYKDFRSLVDTWPVIPLQSVIGQINNPQMLKNQISFWNKKGLVHTLKKGLYILNEQDRKKITSREFIANQLVFPSYVSMESALALYQMIPETVYQVTSITFKKTISFTNILGTFVYRNLKSELFFGYSNIKDESQLPYLLAEKEKAFLDFAYLNMKTWSEKSHDIFEESYRMENLDTLDQTKLQAYLKKFNSKKLTRIIQNHF